jgi:hypothetical protein
MVLLVFVWWLQFAAEEARISLPLLRHSGERNQYKSWIWSSQWFFLHVALNFYTTKLILFDNQLVMGN